jgi:hypothetical protein
MTIAVLLLFVCLFVLRKHTKNPSLIIYMSLVSRYTQLSRRPRYCIMLCRSYPNNDNMLLHPSHHHPSFSLFPHLLYNNIMQPVAIQHRTPPRPNYVSSPAGRIVDHTFMIPHGIYSNISSFLMIVVHLPMLMPCLHGWHR